ncbi:MAG TPA: hypothetical protein VMV24_02515 [Candidatus Dormibacteraeota bacterium]|nr:hypothetical protein [Candidatus Dormibacteraeota bacterium]
MGKLNRNNKGFGGVEFLLVIIIVVLIGVVGWFVYKNHNKTTITTIAANPYAGWVSAELQYEKISYKYPSNWKLKDSSVSIPKSLGNCTYPGSDYVSLTSPNGDSVVLKTGVDCIGDGGSYILGSIPIKSLSSDVFLSFQNTVIGVQAVNPTQPSFACLEPNANTGNGSPLAFDSKNIFYGGGGDSNNKPVNEFCYYPSKFNENEGNSVNTDSSNNISINYSVISQPISSIENEQDFNTAKLIFESMAYK